MPFEHAAVGCDVNGIRMTSRSGTIDASSLAVAVRAVVGACAALIVFSAFAQEVQVPGRAASDPPVDASAAPSPNPIFQPGFIDGFGRWLQDGTAKLKSGMQDAQENFDKLGNQTLDAAKDVTGKVVGLPNTRVVAVRERCALAQNGGPDCQAAATLVCRGKGFQAGKSLDTQSEQKCPMRFLREGRAPNHTECPTEIFVTRAMCQ